MPSTQIMETTALNEEQGFACPIRYVHNPLHSSVACIQRAYLSFPIKRTKGAPPVACICSRLTPQGSEIPFCSSIPTVYESRFWKDSIEASRTFIHLLSVDKSVGDVTIRGGVTLSKISRHELRPGLKHRCSRATAYMYPFSVESPRLEIIAVLMAMLFLFDDKCEGADEEQVPALVSDFLSRLADPTLAIQASNGPLQAYLDLIIKGIHAADGRKGDGGAEVYMEMKKTFTYLRPVVPLTSVEAYLKFRHRNVCAGFVFASVKFSLASNVDIHQPEIQQFMMWAADHLSITNDLYSYEKEAAAFREGSCPDLINIVTVLADLLNLPDEGSALEMAYMLVLQREQWMMKEIEKFDEEDCLDVDTWEYLWAVWACLSGNTFYSMTCERYGGPKSRIPERINSLMALNQNGEQGARIVGNEALEVRMDGVHRLSPGFPLNSEAINDGREAILV